MSVVYNQIANRSLERIGALSDGLFDITSGVLRRIRSTSEMTRLVSASEEPAGIR